MIDNGYIFDFIKTISNKDDRGNVFSPNDFNDYLPKANLELYIADYQKWELTQRITDTLRFFFESDTITFTSGAASIPTDYKHAISCRYDESGTDRNIDIVTKLELSYRLASPIIKPTLRHPVLSINTELNIYPTAITSAVLDYLRLPVEPFFDYYYANGTTVTYMPPGTEHTATPTDPYRDGTTTGVKASISVELEYDDDDKIKIITTILGYYGLSIPDNLILQVSEAKKTKEEGMI